MPKFRLNPIRLFHYIVLAALFAGMAWFGTACPFGKKKTGSDGGEFTGAGPSRTAAVTPMGVQVKKAAGTVAPGIITAIDAGLTKAFTIAKQPPNNYKGFSEHGNFTVGLWPRSAKCINPGFTTRADGSDWDGQPVDKDPRPGKVLLCIAGITFYGHSDGGTPGGHYGMLVVDDEGLMPTIVWFEAEHEIVYQVDLNRWLATSGVHAHPFMGHGTDALAQGDHPRFTAWMLEITEDIDLGDGLRARAGDRACVLITN